MLEYIDKIRELAKTALHNGTVEMVIGFRKGTVPLMNEPHLIRKPEQIHQLVWDSNCGINLVNYLTDRKEKIGVIAKGCDSRNIVTHIIENKIKREQLYIIGIPCKGMVDRHQIAALFDSEIEEAMEKDGKIIVRGKGKEKIYPKTDVLQENCTLCIHRNPVVYDALVADPVEEQSDVDRFGEVRRIEAMTPKDKTRYFDDLLSNCIRCYACRNACPLCYCPTCFVDESRPQWLGKSQDSVDVKTFHFLRAFHCAGRCTDCGACERACPAGIKMRILTKKLEKDCLELYSWEAGIDLEKRPPLDTYKAEDPNDFIK